MTRSPILDETDRLRAELPENFRDDIVESLYAEAARISATSLSHAERPARPTLDKLLDRILTHRVWGFLAMGVLLFGVFWFTIAGAAVPSDLLSGLLVEHGHEQLTRLARLLSLPDWMSGLLVDGVYLSTAWVVAVMLPPMAIFFPLFTILEDFGYLPRVAFNLDRLFAKAGAHGKQALTMMMGYGCNAAGVTATRVIDSPRERLIAVITNNFSICNGRWPVLILLGTVFLGQLAPPPLAAVVAAASVTTVAALGVLTALVVSWGLSRTVLRGATSVYSLELPPYRPPRVWRTLYTSLIDRTLKVLRRAVTMAAPAGAVTWLISNITVADASLAAHLVDLLAPLGWLMGLNGIILLAYLVAVPANEIVVPTILMLTMTLGTNLFGAEQGVLLDLGTAETATVLVQAGGWTLLTAVNLMLFTLLHNPCGTTILTIWHETRSATWTAVATLLPVGLGIVVTSLTAAVARWAGWG
ncbi:nucleoside recognition domain-containing protein [Actinopolyspora mortivallis]|uniref:Iron transporter FeoB n=1 Tax=Actinopolyspora mortivallis TaxID=33906 RepID=A0A2T0GVC5_ACTMO|nr:nucleoside recognition domain-containing protein [Actinopolyspora mortivallis]PRW63061.1 iron transporter FeoB [Actinopolyspora mortivallis]